MALRGPGRWSEAGAPGDESVLPERLRAIADLLPEGARLVDVGAADGRLCRWLLGRARVANCIATEIDARAGRRLVALEGVPGLRIRLGDGLTALRAEDRAEVLVMSGLGARTMLRILEAAPQRVADLRRLVLQPQTESGRLRRWLVGHGLAIVEERMTCERGRFYVTLASEPRPVARPVSQRGLGFDDLMEAGPCLVRSGGPLVREYWQRNARRLTRLLGRATTGPGRQRVASRLALARRVLATLDAARSDPARLL